MFFNFPDTIRAELKKTQVIPAEDLASTEITNNLGKPGIEMGMDYLTLQSDYQAISFIRFFLINNRFIAFSISGSEDDIPRLMDYKDTFFNSINFY